MLPLARGPVPWRVVRTSSDFLPRKPNQPVHRIRAIHKQQRPTPNIHTLVRMTGTS